LLTVPVVPAREFCPAQVDDSAQTLTRALTEAAELEYRLGDWPAAHGSATEAVRVARLGDLHMEAINGLTRLALIEAAMGKSEPCRDHAREAIRLSRSHGTRTQKATALEVIGFLELGLGHIDAAVRVLKAVGEMCSEHPSAWRSALTWAGDLAEACLRRGDRCGAEQALASLEARATHSGSCVLVSALERSRAALAADDDFETGFNRALEWATRAHQPFEKARTELSFGERLLLRHRTRPARELLLSALAVFDALGSDPWAGRAREALASAG
jgi:hypothetical protein